MPLKNQSLGKLKSTSSGFSLHSKSELMGEGDIVIHRSSSHKSCLIWKNELRDSGVDRTFEVFPRGRGLICIECPLYLLIMRFEDLAGCLLCRCFLLSRKVEHGNISWKQGGCGRANQRFRGTEMGICKCVKRVGLIPIHWFQMLNGRSVWGTNWVVSFSSSIRMRIPNWFVERLTTTTFFRRGTEG